MPVSRALQSSRDSRLPHTKGLNLPLVTSLAFWTPAYIQEPGQGCLSRSFGVSEPASPEVGFLSGISVSLACFCYCLHKTLGERKADPVVGTRVLTDLNLWGFEKFTAACSQAVFPGQLRVCMCVSSREAVEFRCARCGCRLAEVLEPVVRLWERPCPLGAFATVLSWVGIPTCLVSIPPTQR